MSRKRRLFMGLLISVAFIQDGWSTWLQLSTSVDATARSHNEQGISLASKGENDGAIAEFNKALALSPDFVRAFFNRGLVYLRMGQYDQAIADFDKVLEIGNKNAGARVIREATDVPKEQYAQVYLNRGTARLYQAEYDLAIADFTKALEIDLRLARAFNNRAAAYLEKGQFDQAKSDLEDALELNGKYALAYMNRGVLYYRKAENDLAIRDHSLAIQLDPKLALAYANRGNAYARQQRFDRAHADFTKALELNPRCAVAYVGLANLFTLESKYADAEPLFKKALAIFDNNSGPTHPNIVEVLKPYASMLRKVGRDSEAAEMEARSRAIRAMHGRN